MRNKANASATFNKIDRLFNKNIGIYYLVGSSEETKTHCDKLIDLFFPNLVFEKQLGEGHEGKVSLIRYFCNNRWFFCALKELITNPNEECKKSSLLNAKNMKGEWLTLLNHRGMSCQGHYVFAYHRNMDEVCIISAAAAQYFYNNMSELGNNEFEMGALIMDYYPNSCSLLKLIETTKIHEHHCRVIAFRICTAVAFLHSAGIMHRDLKPDNMLFLEGGKIKIIDFGFAVSCKKEERKKKALGTPIYLPPRVARAKFVPGESPSYSTKRDCYAVAVTLFMLATGLFPFFDEESEKRILTTMFIERRGIATTEPFCNDIKDPKLLDLIQNLGAYKEKDRFTMDQAVAHPYFDAIRESRSSSPCQEQSAALESE